MPRESLASPVPLTFRNRRGFLRILSVLKPDIFFISFRRLGLPAELLLTNLWYPPFSFVHDVFFLSEVILDC